MSEIARQMERMKLISSVLLRVLRVNGNPALQSDYDSWASPSFRIGVGE